MGIDLKPDYQFIQTATKSFNIFQTRLQTHNKNQQSTTQTENTTTNNFKHITNSYKQQLAWNINNHPHGARTSPLESLASCTFNKFFKCLLLFRIVSSKKLPNTSPQNVQTNFRNNSPNLPQTYPKRFKNLPKSAKNLTNCFKGEL